MVEAAERIAFWARHPGAEGVETLGPAPHVMLRLRGKYRWHVTLRSARRKHLLEEASRVLERIESERLPAGVRAAVDVDPQSVL